MGNKRISDLPSASTPVAGDKLIINQDGGTKKLDVVDLGNSIMMGTTIRDIADLKAFDDIVDNKTLELLGYHEEGDGGGGTFFWDAASAVADNGGTVIAPTFAGFSGTGRWTRVYSGAVDVKWFGAKGDDSTDDTAAIQAWLSFVPDNSSATLSKGTYCVTDTINIGGKNYVTFDFFGSIKRRNGSTFNHLSSITSSTDCVFNTLSVDGNRGNATDTGSVGEQGNLVIGGGCARLTFNKFHSNASIYPAVVSNGNTSHISWNETYLQDCGEHGWYISGGGNSDWSFNGGYVEDVGNNVSIAVDHGNSVFKIRRTSLTESNTNISVRDMRFNTTEAVVGTRTFVFDLLDVTNLLIENCSLHPDHEFNAWSVLSKVSGDTTGSLRDVYFNNIQFGNIAPIWNVTVTPTLSNFQINGGSMGDGSGMYFTFMSVFSSISDTLFNNVRIQLEENVANDWETLKSPVCRVTNCSFYGNTSLYYHNFQDTNIEFVFKGCSFVTDPASRPVYTILIGDALTTGAAKPFRFHDCYIGEAASRSVQLADTEEGLGILEFVNCTIEDEIKDATSGHLKLIGVTEGDNFSFNGTNYDSFVYRPNTLTELGAVRAIFLLKAVNTDTVVDNQSVEVLGYHEEGDGGGGSFYWDALSVEADNGGTVIIPDVGGTGRWKRIVEGKVNVLWFGAKGDGTTNDLLAFQSAVEFCTDSFEFYTPPKTYLINPIGDDETDMVEPSEFFTFNWDGGGATIKTDIPTWGTRDEGSPVHQIFDLKVALSVTAGDLGADITEGDEILTLSSALYAQVSPGDALYIQDNQSLYGDGATFYKNTWAVTIKQMLGSDQVLVNGRAPESFLMAQSADVDVIPVGSGISINNLRFLGEGADQSLQVQVTGVRCRNVIDSTFSDIVSVGLNWTTLHLHNAVNCTVRNMTVTTSERIDYSSNYGIILQGVFSSIVTGCRFQANRHGFDTTGEPCYELHVYDCHMSSTEETGGTGVNSHNSRKLIFRNCDIRNGVRWSGHYEFHNCDIEGIHTGCVFNYRFGCHRSRKLLVQDCSVKWPKTINTGELLGLIVFGVETTPGLQSEFGEVILKRVDVTGDLITGPTTHIAYNPLLYITDGDNRPTANLDLLHLEDVTVDRDNLRLLLFAGTALSSPSNGGGKFVIKNFRPGGLNHFPSAVYGAFKEYDWEGFKPLYKPEFELISDPANIVRGGSYIIHEREGGDFDFSTIGAADNNIGRKFTATGSGSGTGVVYRIDKGLNTISMELSGTGNKVRIKDSQFVTLYDADNLIHTLTGDIQMENVEILEAIGSSTNISLDVTGDVEMKNFTWKQTGGRGSHDSIVETQDAPSISAGSFTIGNDYEINSAGDTDFTLIGAADSNPGTVFTATGAGTGTGTAWELNLTLDGVAVSGGEAQFFGSAANLDWKDVGSTGSQIIVSSGNIDESGVTFTVSGTDYLGSPILEDIDGSFNYMISQGISRFKIVDSIVASGRYRQLQVGHVGFNNYGTQLGTGINDFKGEDIVRFKGGILEDRGANAVRSIDRPKFLTLKGFKNIKDHGGSTPSMWCPGGGLLIDSSTGEIYMSPGQGPKVGVAVTKLG